MLLQHIIQGYAEFPLPKLMEFLQNIETFQPVCPDGKILNV